MKGQTILHYRIEERLGSGGMGVVYKAVDTRLERTVALKFLPIHLSHDEVAKKRFMVEARAASALEHQNICTIYDIGETDDGQLFIVMSYYDGETLKYRLEDGAFSVEDAVSVARQLAEGLAAAHDAGIVHRDVKPANVMVTAAGQVKLLDFGIAKFSSSVDLTREGTSVGTAAYMSPEQSRGEQVDGRTDVWSVGAVLYEMLAGRPPFSGGYEAALLYAILNDAPTALEELRPDLDQGLCAVVAKCLSKDPADRYASADALWEALVPFAPLTSSTRLSSGPAGPDATAMIRTAAIYCVATAAVLVAVYGAMMLLGLPGWLFPAGVVLMLIGLPIVLYALHAERARARLGTAERARLEGLRGWLTMRRAMRGGFLAMGGLATVTAVFMLLRILGVGPFATLISSGQIDDESVVIVADFDNRTDDLALGKSVTQAFRIDLSQSTVVNLMDGSRIAAALVRMRRDPTTPITAELAREIAIREGAKGYIAGDIGSAGNGYVLSAGIFLASDGSQLVGIRESARSDDDVLTAIDRLSARLREKVGESLVNIRADKPLREVTTPSLEALRLYSEAQDLTRESEDRLALDRLHEAVALDSTFAMAWRKLAVVQFNLGSPLKDIMRASTKAFENRANATERERLQIEANYAEKVVIDEAKVKAAYEAILKKWPYDLIALNNLQFYYNDEGRHEETEAMARRALEVADGWVFRSAYVRNLQYQGKYVESARALADWALAFPGDVRVTQSELKQALLQGRIDTVRVLADSIAARYTTQDAERIRLNMMQRWAAETGHLRLFSEAVEQDTEINIARGARSAVLTDRIRAALARLPVTEDIGAARVAIRRALAETPLDSISVPARPYVFAAEAYTRIGDLTKSNELLDEYDETVPAEQRGRDEYYRFMRGYNKVVAGDADVGIEEAQKAFESHRCYRLCSLYFGEMYAIAGRTDEAIEFLVKAVDAPDGYPWQVPAGRTSLVFEQLGDLFATSGDLDKAIEYLSRFTDWWQDADPELQPRVQAARDRIDELLRRKSGEPSAVG